MRDTISLLVIDHEQLIAAAIAALCERIPRVRVLANVHDSREGLLAMQSLHPRVALVDLVMPQLNGIEVAAQALARGLCTRVIILTENPAEEFCIRALRRGAAGYLLKSSATTELELAVCAVGNGKTYISPSVAHAFANDRAIDSIEDLTSRHREVLQLIIEGHTNKEISTILTVGVKTVEKHRAELMRRLHVNSTAELVCYAIRHYLVT